MQAFQHNQSNQPSDRCLDSSGHLTVQVSGGKVDVAAKYLALISFTDAVITTQRYVMLLLFKLRAQLRLFTETSY